MKVKQIWANLASSDLTQTTRFYTALGFEPNGIHSGNNDLTSFKFGSDGFVIHFFRKDLLASNTNSVITDTASSNEVIFSLSADSKGEVEDWAEKVRAAGGRIDREPQVVMDKGFGFDFADPDGHKFIFLYWPQ